MIYAVGRPEGARLVWVSRDTGEAELLTAPPSNYFHAHLSPDEKRILVDFEPGNMGIFEISSGVFEPLGVGNWVAWPGVLARPLVQDAVLGSSLQLMGPGELSYMTQASALYSLFDIDPPATGLRPQIMVLGAALTRRLEKLGLTLEEALRHESEVDDWLARRSAPDLVDSSRERILAEVDSLRTDALRIDPQLDRPWQKTRAQIERALEAFSMRLRSAAARLDETARWRLEAIRCACLPAGAPQERLLSVAHFALTYGQDFATTVWQQMDHDSDRIQIVDPEAGSE